MLSTTIKNSDKNSIKKMLIYLLSQNVCLVYSGSGKILYTELDCVLVCTSHMIITKYACLLRRQNCSSVKCAHLAVHCPHMYN